MNLLLKIFILCPWNVNDPSVCLTFLWEVKCYYWAWEFHQSYRPDKRFPVEWLISVIYSSCFYHTFWYVEMLNIFVSINNSVLCMQVWEGHGLPKSCNSDSPISRCRGSRLCCNHQPYNLWRTVSTLTTENKTVLSAIKQWSR